MRTQIVGILNITPDSFSDGGVYYKDIKKAVIRAEQLVKEGADIIDVGGESTRPGSEHVTIDEELDRVIPVIQALTQKLPYVTLSIDTWKHEVAEKALMAGCQMINSLGGFTLDEKMAQVAGKHACPIIIYHIKGIPKSMQQGEIHYTDVIAEITTFFEEQIAFGNKMGVTRKQFILDPGIGFGKTVEQNIAIINHLEEFAKLQLPLLLGFSRKSHVGMILQTELGLQDMPTPIERVEGSLAETALAVLNGATMIRTHDVLPTKRFLTVLERITKK